MLYSTWLIIAGSRAAPLVLLFITFVPLAGFRAHSVCFGLISAEFKWVKNPQLTVRRC